MDLAGMTRVEWESRSKLKPLISWKEFLRATPTLRHLTCGKPNCKCQRGEKHTALVLTRIVNGKAEQLHIPKDSEKVAREWIERYREILSLLEKISSCSWDRLKKKNKTR
jgi:hypothetical protein